MTERFSRREALKTFGAGLFVATAGGSLVALLSGCDSGPKRLGAERIIAVEPHHATRVFIQYKDKNGQTYKDTIHQSNTFRCGDIMVDPHDFLERYGGTMPYGPFDAEKYQTYRVTHPKKDKQHPVVVPQ